jgi:histone H1/5
MSSLYVPVCRVADRPSRDQFAEDKYKMDMSTNSRLSQLNRAIQRGVDDGIFVFPKGPSGKVKLAPKNKPATDTKEVRSAHVVRLASYSSPALVISPER